MKKAHRLARAVAHGNLNGNNVAPVTAPYEGQMYLAIGVRFNKAGMRLAWPLNETLR